MAMVRYELGKDRMEINRNSSKVAIDPRPSIESMVRSLCQLTVCRIVEKGKRKYAVHSNWDTMSNAVFANILGDVNSGSIFPA